MTLPSAGGVTVALTCPQCGGQADQHLARCLHCQSALATVRCASCFGLAFDGNAHCPQCGDTLESPALVTHDTGREPQPCPSCRSNMDATVVDKTLVDGCPACGGVWLDHVAFERLIRKRKYSELTATLNVPQWDRGASAVKRDPTGGAYVRCPACEHFMHRRNFATNSGIILDVCAAHGIWFDANELAGVIRYRDDGSAIENLRFPKQVPRGYRPDVQVQRPEYRNNWVETIEFVTDLLTGLF